MAFNFNFGENTVFLVVCALIALIAIIFFIVVYVADYKESRAKAKKRRAFERDLERAHRRRQRQH